MNFSERLESAVKSKESCLMLGLDPNPDKMPKHFHNEAIGLIENGETYEAVWAKLFAEFCLEIMMECKPYIMGVKIQMAYFEVLGSHGILAVEHIIKLAKKNELVILVDGKRNDIGSTCEAYAQAYLEDGPLGVDALTVSPFLGSDGILPFVQRCETKGRGIFVLAKTSNPSAGELQNDVADTLTSKIEEWGESTRASNGFSSVGAVVGATNGEELKTYRERMPHTWILAPGVGAQGGSMDDVLAAQKDGLGVIIPVSRGILYAGDGEDFVQKAGVKAQALWEAQKR